MEAGIDFTGCTGLITGGATGIGAATARWLDRHGIVDRNPAPVASPGLVCAVEVVEGDVSDPALWERADEMANSIGFLLSDLAANVTGTVHISDDGGSL